MVFVVVIAVLIELIVLMLHFAPQIHTISGLGTVSVISWAALLIAGLAVVIGGVRLTRKEEADKRSAVLIMLLISLVPALHTSIFRKPIDLAVTCREGVVSGYDLQRYLNRYPDTIAEQAAALFLVQADSAVSLAHKLGRFLNDDGKRLQKKHRQAIIKACLKRIDAAPDPTRLEAYRALSKELRFNKEHPALQTRARNGALQVALRQLTPREIKTYGAGAKALIGWLRSNKSWLRVGLTLKQLNRDGLSGKGHVPLSKFSSSCNLLESWTRAGIVSTTSPTAVLRLEFVRRGSVQTRRFDVHDSRNLFRYDPRTGKSLGGKTTLKLPFYQVDVRLYAGTNKLFQWQLQTATTRYDKMSKPTSQSMLAFQQSLYKQATETLCSQLRKSIDLAKLFNY